MSDDRPLRIVLLGCGRISERHIDAISANPHVELVAVCDELLDRARAAGEKAEVPFFTSYVEMRDSVPADVAAICTPSGRQPNHGRRAAERKLNVICEKPMATRLEEADALVRACDDRADEIEG